MKLRKVGAMVLATALAVTGLAGCGAVEKAAPAASAAAQTTASAGTSGSKLQQILDRGHLIVGTGSTNAPWHFYDDNGNLTGMDIDMAKIVAKALFDDETKIEFVEQSGDNRVPNLMSDTVDICFQFMTITPARAQQIDFTVPYYTEGVGLLLSTNGKYKSGDELKAAVEGGTDITVAILQNSYAEDIVNALLPGAKAEQYEDQGMLYQALDSGRCDAAAVDASSVSWYALQNPDKYIESGITGYPQNYGAGVKQGEQEWLNFVNTVLIDAMTGANYQQYIDAYQKWFNVELDPPTVGMPAMFR